MGNPNRKPRHENQFCDVDFTTKFPWVKNAKRITNFMPLAKETYQVDFEGGLHFFDDGEVKRTFEKFCEDFFKANNGKNQVVCNWQEQCVKVVVL